jgi:ribosomal protein S18 acetylase RimI-like enzyme
MPNYEIRTTISNDIHRLMQLDHSVDTDYVWQMEYAREGGYTALGFREVRLPRQIHLLPPRPASMLADTWTRSEMLTLLIEGAPAGYLRMSRAKSEDTLWVTDIVVGREHRRQNLASAMLNMAEMHGIQHGLMRLWLETNSKNVPSIRFAQKNGMEFCGYSDQYYRNRDIALFFYKAL